MDHTEATRLAAAERYLLGELTAEQRAAFEEHFFECPECAAEVRLGAELIDNLKPALAPLRPPAAPEAQRRAYAWLHWAPAAAAVVLAAGLTVQLVGAKRQLAEFSSPQPVSSYFLAATRGEGALISLPSGAKQVLITLAPVTQSGVLKAVLKNTAGEKLYEFSLPAVAGQEISLLLPVATLADGPYFLELYDPSSLNLLSQYRFTLKRH